MALVTEPVIRGVVLEENIVVGKITAQRQKM